MINRFASQLFDAPAEIVVAHGRVVLAGVSLAAISLDPTEPPDLSNLVASVLIIYACYALAILMVLHWRFIHNVRGVYLHAIDFAVLALLLFLTEGLSSPFLVFFTFALLAASLRWDWPGIALTMLGLLLLAGFVGILDFTQGRVRNLNQTVIRAAYLFATGTILAYASAHREHERARLATLAHWPGSLAEHAAGPLAATLRQAAAVLDSRLALVIWEEDRGSKAAVWQDGTCHTMASDNASPKLSVAPAVRDLTFSRTLPDLDRLNLVNGSIHAMPDVLSGELASRLPITDFASAPIQASLAKGRLFIIGNIRPSDDHLLITRIVADRVGAELDRQIFLERAAETAAMRERASIMRDLHDGLLQNLTAARAQLEMLPADGEYAKMQLDRTRELLRTEQRRVREFVDQTHAADNENVALETLRPLAEETARFWGCVLSLSLQPPKAIIPRKMANQLSLMLAEAVANAVRHGLASAMEVTVDRKDDLLEFTVRDDGHGFPVGRGVRQPLEISEAQLPRSLNARVVDLRGRLYASTSDSGSLIHIELPL